MKKEINSQINWIDLVNPTDEDLNHLKQKYDLHEILISELKEPSTRTKIEIYDRLMFIVYYLPNYNEEEQNSKAIEIDFLLTKDSIITVRYQNYIMIDQIFDSLKNDLSNYYLNQTPAHLLYYILEEGLTFSLRQLVHIHDKIQKIEDELFEKENHKELIKKIAIIKRDVLNQRLIARPQHPILESLKQKGVQFFGKDLEIYFNDLLGDYEKVWINLDNLKETIESLENTNNTFFESKTNEIVKILTIITFIMFPFSVIPNMFGMNIDFIPFSTSLYGFWYVIALITFITLIFLTIIKIKKWF
ncbi:MAG TPA: magnesium transporter CorA family protein [Candidatus Paceibacterota bacterium]|jgi:magnesium transporter|nr:magnesium transporter CorA family protein [Parcubacteria group bacterium]HOM33173.1 magnesium transporter CorA family protein [Candidatus Paceibacterota bacterium]HPC37268.1 magnesium transporter CorA family protein [Candidatus Paceibacterota bacterium]HRU35725.1 magnesium transporter CorA family protein [Candidatus Paceibacterota bacterium]